MRSFNVSRNIIAGLFGQLSTTVLNFISRTVFVYILGAEYLGINGLFTNVLTVLNIAELGISSAIVFSLYEPLHKQDIKKVQAIMNLYRKIYFVIGIIVLVLGIALIPILPYMMKGSTTLVNINIVYLLFLLQTVFTYWFFSYKSALPQADQNQYIVSLATAIINAVKILVQIVVLLISKSFLLYLVASVVFSVINNYFIAKKVDQKYPYIRLKNQEKVTKNEKRYIFKNVAGMAMYKISGTVLNSADNIIISSFIGVVTVGIYSNYLLIIRTLISLVGIVFSSFTSSIGNLFVSESKEKGEFIFRCLNFLNFWVYGFCAICLWNLFNPFITLWIGSSYLLTKDIVFIIILNFVTDGLEQAVIAYKDACGLFWKGKIRPVVSSILNIILSIVLVKPLGIFGVILGTILTRFLTTWWFDPLLVYRNVFNMSPKRYYFRYIRSLLLIIIMCWLTGEMCNLMPQDTILGFVGTCAISFIFPNIIFYILFRKSAEFSYIFNTGKNVLVKLLNIRNQKGE